MAATAQLEDIKHMTQHQLHNKLLHNSSKFVIEITMAAPKIALPVRANGKLETTLLIDLGNGNPDARPPNRRRTHGPARSARVASKFRKIR